MPAAQAGADTSYLYLTVARTYDSEWLLIYAEIDLKGANRPADQQPLEARDRSVPRLTTAATLQAHGTTNIETARQAAEALRPLAGNAAYWLFTLGLIGTGMLGVPVLAGSSAYAMAEGGAWKGSLEKKPAGARRFYAVLAAAMLGGLLINYLRLDAVKMMFWAAVINGALAPLILLVVLLTSDRKVMGSRVNAPLLRITGWCTFAVMTAATIGMLIA
ncbi:MAG TPA: divalent metal cation transporter [Bryobacteraceae bacterium]